MEKEKEKEKSGGVFFWGVLLGKKERRGRVLLFMGGGFGKLIPTLQRYFPTFRNEHLQRLPHSTFPKVFHLDAGQSFCESRPVVHY